MTTGDTGVALVTDSTGYLPPGTVARHGIGVVPLHVVLGHRSGTEGDEVCPHDVAVALTERRLRVSTSRPTPTELAAAYRASGARSVVSVHLSSALSGTVDSAHLAAAEVAAEGIEVRVVDSRTICMGLGFAVLAAAREVERGGDLGAVEAAARASDTDVLFYLDTLEHLRRGGRIGSAAALFGSALSIKPLLHVAGGELAALEKVRTASKAMTRLEDLAVARAGDGPVDVAVHHLAAPNRAEALAERMRVRLPGLVDLHVSEVGAVVGAHVGPGAQAVVIARRGAARPGAARR